MPSYHCLVCHRPLSDFTSVKIGIGPICRKRESEQGCLEFYYAVFSVIEVKCNYILIKDTGHENHRTVTNDIQFVLAELAGDYDIRSRRIFYVDSEGQIDEILHTDKVFHGFKRGHEGVKL